MPTRRQFLKAGAAGGLMLAGLGAWYGVRRHLQRAGTGGLSEREQRMVAAIAASILAGALPGGAEARGAAIRDAVHGVAQAIASLSAPAQKEVAELFALLDFAPARAAATGVWLDWDQPEQAQVDAFLARWRYSRFGLLRSAYQALHDLVLGGWYGQPRAWQAIGYPGPPRL